MDTTPKFVTQSIIKDSSGFSVTIRGATIGDIDIGLVYTLTPVTSETVPTAPATDTPAPAQEVPPAAPQA